MSLEQLSELLPEYAKDIKLNLSSVFKQQELSETQLWGTALASALSTGNQELISTIRTEAQAHLTPAEVDAAQTAFSLMSMNNIFYRFAHLSTNEQYRSMPARLRMNSMRSHKAEASDFEMWCLAVSAINACGLCIDSHERVLREKGVREESILAAIRVASVIQAVASVLTAEAL